MMSLYQKNSEKVMCKYEKVLWYEGFSNLKKMQKSQYVMPGLLQLRTGFIHSIERWRQQWKYDLRELKQLFREVRKLMSQT